MIQVDTDCNLCQIATDYPHSGRYNARAKYIPNKDGELVLAMVQGFSFPMFNPDGVEDQKKGKNERSREENDENGDNFADIERATRRAKINAFDKILCNHDLDTFATFTYSPDSVADKSSWENCYNHLKVWLSNRVTRNGLKYVVVPERHKSGAIHFHGIMNSSALRLVRARSAKSGRALSHNGNPLYNIDDWSYGFSSAEIIKSGAEDRTKVAKYIFKYMGKQTGQKIGGRYMLSGGDLVTPTFLYDDSVDTFTAATPPIYSREVDLGDGKKYYEYSYI